MKQRKQVLLFFILLMLVLLSGRIAASSPITLDLQEADLAATVYHFAALLNKNIVLSPNVQGKLSAHFYQVNAQQAFDMLLLTHDLGSWQQGGIVYVAPKAELIKLKQGVVDWQKLSEASMPLEMRTWHISYANAKDLAHLLRDEHGSLLSKRGKIRFDKRTNTVCVQDIHDSLVSVGKLIHQLDAPVPQVNIEVRLASVDSDYERQLGIEFNQHAVSGDNHSGSQMAVGFAGRYRLAFATLADGALLDMQLAALENEGHAELISSPSLFTLNQESASIEAGEEVPYQQVSEGGGTAVVFKKAVLGLKVLPQVLPGGRILLQLRINQDRPSERMVLGVPTIRTRQIASSVLLKSGQTIVLGGIYETNSEAVEHRIPFIGRIPLLGALISRHDQRQSRRELLIFVRPTVVSQA